VRGNSAALSAQVLHEIPEQVLGYMAINRILPKQVCVLLHIFGVESTLLVFCFDLLPNPPPPPPPPTFSRPLPQPFLLPRRLLFPSQSPNYPLTSPLQLHQQLLAVSTALPLPTTLLHLSLRPPPPPPPLLCHRCLPAGRRLSTLPLAALIIQKPANKPRGLGRRSCGCSALSLFADCSFYDNNVYDLIINAAQSSLSMITR
jgi:hypothetical protein